MGITFIHSPLSGSIAAIPSKSAAHRALICAALAKGETDIYCPALSKDIEATADCLRALGAKIDYREGSFHVRPIEKPRPMADLNCGESGSTLRFLLPVVCALGCGARIKMGGRLPQRPLSPLWEELERHGARLSHECEDLLLVGGQLSSGEYRIRADISSQFISGLLFALPLLDGDSSLELEGNIESIGYIRMTERVQRLFGLELPFEGRRYAVARSAAYRSPGGIEVEGDWSNAAFWLTASMLSGGGIELTGLDEDSAQGDRAIIEALAKIRSGGAVIDAKDIPDLVPVLAVAAAGSAGRTEFINAGRLRIKESDRIASVYRMIGALGGHCEELAEGLIVEGSGKLRGGVVDGENDHRIVMSAAVAAIICSEPVTVLGAQASAKSYPGFFEDYRMLGGKTL